ncbi:hypothetical protein OQA88_3999 [Cercophora sp. LCS_1]
MSTDGQQDHPVPLVKLLQVDHFLLGAEDSRIVTPPHTPPTYPHLHSEMVGSHYLSPGPHHTDRIQSDGLRDSTTSCSSGPSTGAYTTPELDPYSATSGVSSFNYPAAADPSLLTPVSSAASPPLQQRPATKVMRSYHHAQATASGAQIPTPPNTSKMYYASNYDMGSSSQGSSPMTVHPQVTEASQFDMAPYMAHSSPGNQHPSSPKAEVPPPIDPYLGHFTVSGANDDVTQHGFHGYHQFPEVDPELIPRHQHPGHFHIPAPHLDNRLSPNGVQASILPQSHHTQYRQEPPPGVGDLRGSPMIVYPAQAPPSKKRPAKRSPSFPNKRPRTPKGSTRLGSMDGGFEDDKDMEELTLRDDAPEDDKYLFQLRKEFLSEKGKGMWEEMKAKYSENHQGNWEKAALQMKVSRAVAKFGVWPKREIERLQEAHQYFEEKRYQLILARMKENGGCRVWDWKPQHIEAMLVKLGVEEPTIDDKTNSRRRRAKVARRRASQTTPHSAQSHVMGDWSSGLGLHPSFQNHGHAVASRPFDILGDEANIAPTFTSEQENELIEQIFNKPVKTEGSLSPVIMAVAYDDDSGRRSSARDLNHHHSERVARQACEQLMQQQTRGPEHTY